MVYESAAPASTRQGERDEPRLSDPTAARAVHAPHRLRSIATRVLGKDRVARRSRTLPDMPDIPTLVASLDTRLDELVTEISTLEAARAALRTRTLAAPPPAAAHNGATPKRPRRPAPQTNKATPKPGPPATDPRPELATTTATGSQSEASKTRPRASATTTSTKRVSSLSAEQLEQLLAGSGSGLSAGAIAEQAGVGYSRVLARLGELEVSRRVRRTGSRRSTLWLLITDEDRIAQRRAELERLVGARRDDRTQRRGRARAS
jgi:type IV secretory pathway VirB10-like protein